LHESICVAWTGAGFKVVLVGHARKGAVHEGLKPWLDRRLRAPIAGLGVTGCDKPLWPNIRFFAALQ
jgi:hypothetical protein